MRIPAGAALLLLFACGGSPDESGPPEIRYGLDECTHCRMIITEARYAAVARSDEGEEARFDDLMGLRAHVGAAPGSWRAWVHADDGWIPAGDAWFVRDPEEITPMGSGLLAFGDRDAAARRAANSGGEPMSWQVFLTTAPANVPAPPDTGHGNGREERAGSAASAERLPSGPAGGTRAPEAPEEPEEPEEPENPD